MSKFKRYERYKDSGVEWIGEIPEHWEISKLKYLTYCLDGKRIPLSSEQRGEMQGDIPYWGANCIIDYVNDWLIDGEVVLLGEDGAPFFDKYKDVAFYSNEKIWPNNHVHVLRALQSINVKLLTYILNTVDYSNYIKGSTRDKLTQSEMKNIFIQLPPVKEQKAIANFLDQKTTEIDNLIADKEKLIELLQEKRQAIITEAVTKGLNPNVRMKDSGIEWIGEIPEHWEVKRIKYLATVNPSKSEVRHLPPEQEVTFIPMEKIVATGKVDYSITNTVENLIDGYTYFRDGDIIMAKVTPCFENGNIAIVNGLLNGIGFGTTELHVLRCNNKCYNKFLFYYLQSDVFKSKGISEMYGVAGLKRIPTDFVLNYKLGIPDYQEQKQITLYLDTIVDKINTLISDIQTQIDKLKEYRQSIISEAVTGKIKIYNS
jgi:type I restriction enzyme S subunit